MKEEFVVSSIRSLEILAEKNPALAFASFLASKKLSRDGDISLSCTISGSTAAVTTIEFEDGVVRDLCDAIERMAPKDMTYAHDARWGDMNGYSHVRASMIGPSLVIPFKEGRLLLGQWQQIVLIDFDDHFDVKFPVFGKDRRHVIHLTNVDAFEPDGRSNAEPGRRAAEVDHIVLQSREQLPGAEHRDHDDDECDRPQDEGSDSG